MTQSLPQYGLGEKGLKNMSADSIVVRINSSRRGLHLDSHE
jgi:hypothetical protein